MTRTIIAGPYTFTGTDATNVSADTTNWQEQNGVTAFLRIFSNHYRDAFGAQTDCSWKGTGSFTDDQYFEIAIIGTPAVNENDNIGGTLRDNGGGYGSETMYRVFYQASLNSNAGACQVYKVVNGNASHVGTQLGADINGGFASGDLLSAESVTNGANVDINVYKNGTLLATRSDTSSVITGGKPGITGKLHIGGLYGDDWVGGNFTASASVDPGVITGSASTFGLPGLILS